MPVDDSRTPASADSGEPVPVATALPATPSTPVKPRGIGIVIDPRVIVVGGAVALLGVAVLAVFLWMVPTAAARELEAACRGLRTEPQLHPELCPSGRACSTPVPAPDFVAKDITGKDVRLSDYRGKVVLINFWASWCNVCKEEKGGIQAMAAEMAGDDFVVIALASDATWPEPLNALLQSLAPKAAVQGELTMDKVGAAFRQALPNGTPFKVLLDPPENDSNIGPITASWGITKVPDSVLIDRQGNIRAYFENKRDWQSPVAKTCLRSVLDGE